MRCFLHSLMHVCPEVLLAALKRSYQDRNILVHESLTHYESAEDNGQSDISQSPEHTTFQETKKSQVLPLGSCVKELFDVDLSPSSFGRRTAMRFLNVAVPLDTLKDQVDRLGGIEIVTREKRWCEVARNLGLDTARHTSASTRLRIGLESYAARTASGEGKRINAGKRCIDAAYMNSKKCNETRNAKKRGKKSSDFRGVIRRNGGGWHARLYVPLSLRTPGLPMRIFLGPCKSREEAALRCDTRLIQLFGQARAHRYLNFPNLAMTGEPALKTPPKQQIRNSEGALRDSNFAETSERCCANSKDFPLTPVKVEDLEIETSLCEDSEYCDRSELPDGGEINTMPDNEAVWKTGGPSEESVYMLQRPYSNNYASAFKTSHTPADAPISGCTGVFETSMNVNRGRCDHDQFSPAHATSPQQNDSCGQQGRYYCPSFM
jgi:hypothetical protein